MWVNVCLNNIEPIITMRKIFQIIFDWTFEYMLSKTKKKKISLFMAVAAPLYETFASLSNSTILVSRSSIFNFYKGFPCLWPYCLHWPTSLSPYQTQSFCCCGQLLCKILQGIPLFEDVAAPLDNTFDYL